ncbi:hypothetical protein M501DRAFT_764051 [Patellaria atrata CBS 101060]|uniref:Altered inheritance of mitochondria protein 11 n=1 Tax=Patellaria atrata CBS 101060 TaxID=1346257 RepID=A0A9P4VT12_9PEZI|nr:hypothetical protein M501DRAFT_764051 [Patellaria atrata CBS 101060]
MAFLQRESNPLPARVPLDQSRLASSPTSGSTSDSSIFSPRSRRQLGLFFGGAAFFTLSSLITRRSLVRRYKSNIPPYYHPSNRPHGDVNGAMEALEALNIATLNVASIAMMATGGVLWAFDISSMEDMRRKIRGGLGIDGSGRSEKDAEEEFEEWLATTLARKEDKAKELKGKSEYARSNERGASR